VRILGASLAHEPCTLGIQFQPSLLNIANHNVSHSDEAGFAMITREGRVLQVAETHLCQRCKTLVKHTSFSVRYNASPTDPNSVLKTFRWVCSRCGEERGETREILIPSGRARLIGRILKMRDDYDIRSMNISAQNGRLTIEIAFEDSQRQST